MSICGTAKAHCCWFNGEVCQYLTKSTHPDFIWCCSLKRDCGTWAAVYLTPEYINNVKPNFVAIGRPDLECGQHPCNGERCNDCGEEGK